MTKTHTTGELRWLVVNPEGKAVAVLDSQSEAYWFTKNRGHAETAIYFNEGVNYRIAPELLRALEECLPIVDAQRRAGLGEGDIAAMNARVAIAKAKQTE